MNQSMLSPDQSAILNDWRKAGEVIAFTNGVFDLLHAGHVTYLAKAKAMCDRLVVGLNSDASVKTLGKGPNRPINTEQDRQVVLEALRCVDMVVIFEDSTPAQLIEAMQPQLLIKGGDYDPDCTIETDARYIVGSKMVRESGGTVTVIPLLPGRSTTGMIKKSQG